MSQIQKINALIDKVINEELSSIRKDEATTYAGIDAERDAIGNPNYNKLSSDTKKDVIKKLRTGKSVTLEEERETPPATEIAGKIAEMMDSLKAISEGSEDPKMQKIADKAASQLEAAKATLEALTAHEVMLQEKEHDMRVKQAGKKRKTIERYLSKKIKMPEVVEKLMKKMPAEKIAEMMKKAKGELDEDKLAGAMMKVALKESYINKKEDIQYIKILLEADKKEVDKEEDGKKKPFLTYKDKEEKKFFDPISRGEKGEYQDITTADISIKPKQKKVTKRILSDEEIEEYLTDEEKNLPEDKKRELVNRIRSEFELLSPEERQTLSQKEKDELVKKREEQEQDTKLKTSRKVPTTPLAGKSEEETKNAILKSYKNQIIDRIAGQGSTLARKLPNEWDEQDIKAWERIVTEFEKRVSDNIADVAKKERLSKEDYNFDDPNEWVKYTLKYGRSPMPSKLGPPPGLEGMPKKTIGKQAIIELLPKDTLIQLGKEIDANKGNISSSKNKELYDNVIKTLQGSFPEIYKDPKSAADRFENAYEAYKRDIKEEYIKLITDSKKNKAKVNSLHKEYLAIDTALNYFKSDVYDITQDFAVPDKYVLTDKGKEVMKNVKDPKERQKIFASGAKDEYIMRAPEKEGQGVIGTIYGKYYNLANDIFAMIKLYAMAQEDIDSIVQKLITSRESGQSNKVQRNRLKIQSENAKKKKDSIKNIIISLIRKGKGYGWDMEKFIKEYKKYSKFDTEANAYEKYLKALRAKELAFVGVEPKKSTEKEKGNIYSRLLTRKVANKGTTEDQPKASSEEEKDKIKENSFYVSSFDTMIEKLLNEAFGYFKDGVFVYYKKNMV